MVRWSKGRFFAQMMTVQTLAVGETWRVGGSVDLADSQGNPLLPGEYTFRIALSGLEHGKNEPISQEQKVKISWAY